MNAAPTQHPSTSPQAHSSRWALTSLALCMLLSAIGTSIANVGLPTMAQAFGASFQAVQWVVLAYLLAITTLIVSVGRLGDLMGRRRLLVFGLGVFTLASAACGLAPTLGWLIAARALQGLGGAIMMALTLAFVGDTVPKAKTGAAMGLLGSMSAVGTALGPSLGGLLIAGFGWRALFWLAVPLGLLAMLLAVRCLPVDRPAGGRGGFDLPGTLLLALALGAYALAMTLSRVDSALINVTLLLVAVTIGGLFVALQARTASPLISLKLLRQPGLRSGLMMSTLVSTVMMATLIVGPFYLAHGLQLPPVTVGLVLAGGPLAAAFTGVPAGYMADRWGALAMTRMGLASMAAGCLLLSVLPATLGICGYLVPMVVTTLGYALFQTANNTTVMNNVRSEQRGLVSGLLNLSRNLGLISGASAMGAVFAFAAATPDLSLAPADAVAHGMRVTFAVALGLVLLALVVANGRRSSKPLVIDSL